MKRVLCLLENGFEEIEAIAPVDLLRRAGVEVTLAGVSGLEVVGKCGVKVIADAELRDLNFLEFDVLLLPGGPAVMELRKNERVIGITRSFHKRGRLIAAICAAPLLLRDAGLIDGKRITAHFSTTDELPGNTGERLVYDGEFLTSRGAGTAVEFGLELVKVLCGKEAAEDVAASVMV
ncbi:MAG: DJ-1/PfpI family protein [Akkermansiaceae bacterium]|jgi:protein deglycase|nr:DJ-1/PfpI family protein [Akkermansiaceae bacterium]MDP4646840.1 DJ-1/PfpI family protein [Akkermansiaceae bacterium]MDP4719823.1 DJ-1/PfpI family protein [Akkermansiaceae bacterium]MDP4780978.1 DJ-1/PfpI family protein [Akkermansiaceae bacterium]MDP4846819.1 DJ-1/PfpI family protein [Akkermansiaceae bacterium]